MSKISWPAVSWKKTLSDSVRSLSRGIGSCTLILANGSKCPGGPVSPPPRKAYPWGFFRHSSTRGVRRPDFAMRRSRRRQTPWNSGTSHL